MRGFSFPVIALVAPWGLPQRGQGWQSRSQAGAGPGGAAWRTRGGEEGERRGGWQPSSGWSMLGGQLWTLSSRCLWGWQGDLRMDGWREPAPETLLSAASAPAHTLPGPPGPPAFCAGCLWVLTSAIQGFGGSCDLEEARGGCALGL